MHSNMHLLTGIRKPGRADNPMESITNSFHVVKTIENTGFLRNV